MTDGQISEFLIERGLWREVRINLPDSSHKTPALFLDRDGVLNKDTGYVGRLDSLEVWTDLVPLIKAANAKNWPVVMVTNQSGIARKYFGWEDFAKVNNHIVETLGALGAQINAVFACGYHDTDDKLYGIKNHNWRKPNPGMLNAAGETFPIDYANSLIVGDKMGDMKAGAAAGLKNGLLIGNSTDLDTDQTPSIENMPNLTLSALPQINWSDIIDQFTSL